MASYPALDVRYASGPDTAALHDLHDRLYAALDPFEPLAIHDADAGDQWRVFFRLPSQRDDAVSALDAALGDRLLSLTAVDVDDEDWARRSQAALTAIRAGRIVVAPPWDVPAPAAGDIVIVIEPSMGFGTGHHATTRMCLELLQTIGVAGQRVIDVGTGSGVLAIAARRLGAATVTALDNDPDALGNARDNIDGDTHLYGKSLNIIGSRGYPPISVVQSDVSAAGHLRGDVVLANLTAAALRRFAESLRGMVADDGRLIVSGFSLNELNGVAVALGMEPTDVRHDGEWAAALLGRGTGGRPSDAYGS
ncbi:MAG: 50S ribosomal protein L11 methyltransferase [Acidobacteriota bacterium]